MNNKSRTKQIRAAHRPRFLRGIHLMRFGRWKSLAGLVDFCVGEGLAGKHGVELGSFQGESSIVFMEMGVASLACVDAWYHKDYSSRRLAKAERVFDGVAAEFRGRMSKHKGRTLDVLASFVEAGRTFDFAYVDADHSEEAVRADIAAALKVLKPGGLLCGHDYGRTLHPGVTLAVDGTVGRPDRVYADSSWAKAVDGIKVADDARFPAIGQAEDEDTRCDTPVDMSGVAAPEPHD